jgi:hypothetical protein
MDELYRVWMKRLQLFLAATPRRRPQANRPRST